MNNETINGDIRYINYTFDPWTFPVLTACVPFFYILPTIWIIIKIIRVYIHNVMVKKSDTISPHVFFVIVLQLILSFFYMMADYSTIRIPATGLITSWCASLKPNHGLKVLYFLSVYFNYTAMLIPFLLSVLRLLPVYITVGLDQLSVRIVRVSIPLIFIYPLFFCFPLLPALGDCRQLLGTYQFGEIYFYWSGSWFQVAFLINPAASAYFLAIRPYGSDCDFVFVPWIFYLTHPLFKASQVAPRVNSNTII
ncbi:unnamed protein product [Caenorhabditis brenneri]